MVVEGRTCTGQNLCCMWFEVKRLVTPASLCKRRSSKPKRGAGRTMVVSGKMLRTTFSPSACAIDISAMARSTLSQSYLCAEEL